MEANGNISKVDQPTPWCAGMVVVYDIPAEFGTEFEAAEKCSHASLMTYYNDIHRDMAAIFSCLNGGVFHS